MRGVSAERSMFGCRFLGKIDTRNGRDAPPANGKVAQRFQVSKAGMAWWMAKTGRAPDN